MNRKAPPMPPQTWEQTGIWLVMQFPVLAAAFFVTRYFLKLEKQRADEERGRAEAVQQRLMAERDARLSDRDRLLDELRAEVADLKARLSRSRNKKSGGGNET